jgi:DNA-binding response OmpR family regulator
MGTSSREHREETIWHKDGTSLVCDDLSHVMTIDGKDLGLTAAEWRVLRHLIANAGTLVTRDDILGSCFDYTYESYDRIVDTHIKNIRAKLGGQGNAWIETVRGYGYRFAGNLVR